MNVYRVSFLLSAENMGTFLENVGPHLGKMTVSFVEATVDPGEVNPVDQPAPNLAAVPDPKRHRAPRGSKVNDTILSLLVSGPASIKEMKEALVNAGLAAGSLSTGLSLLQKAERIERIEEGKYALTAKAAAE